MTLGLLLGLTLLYGVLAGLYFKGSSHAYIAFTIICYLLQIAVTLAVLLGDPGLAAEQLHIFPEELSEAQAKDQFCVRCNIIRWEGVEHCYYCDVCIVGHDHHCPWSGKCVSAINMTQFYLFVGMTLFSLFYAFTSVFGHLR